MKKIALFALAALCVSAAQAATIKWTALTTDSPDAASWYAASLIAGNFDIANVGKYTAAGAADNYALSTTDTNVTILANKAENGVVVKPNPFSSTFTNVDLSGYTVGDKLTLALYSPGWFNGGHKNLQYATIELTQELLDGNWIEIFVDEYYAGNTSSTALTVTQVVPEPTALALLALGVAGLALKRKHA